VVREARAGDLAAIVLTLEERQGMQVDGFSELVRTEIEAEDALVLVAEVGTSFAGYGRAGGFAHPPDAPDNCAPAGFYLTGLVVAPSHRRHGIGIELTRRRLCWARDRADEAFYFANAQNRASLDLHAQLGFAEVTKDFWYPNVSFAGGRGVLCRVGLP
jgi:GNAT superfamily N-acetyltransferase